MGDWKIYLAGPMGGIEDWNFPAFHKWAGVLRGWGYVVLSPAETAGQVVHLSKTWYMDLDLNYVRVADEIVLLPGWRKSEGAKVELLVAQALGKKCTELVLPAMPAAGLMREATFRLVPVKINLKDTELLEVAFERCALCHLPSAVPVGSTVLDDDDLCNPCRKDQSR